MDAVRRAFMSIRMAVEDLLEQGKTPDRDSTLRLAISYGGTISNKRDITKLIDFIDWVELELLIKEYQT